MKICGIAMNRSQQKVALNGHLKKHTGKRETESGVARVFSPSVGVVAALIFVLTPSCG
jgi:methylmalonyl-CoA mutase cobalamin-binding subunit